MMLRSAGLISNKLKSFFCWYLLFCLIADISPTYSGKFLSCNVVTLSIYQEQTRSAHVMYDHNNTKGQCVKEMRQWFNWWGQKYEPPPLAS